jgi:hypothetical protein
MHSTTATNAAQQPTDSPTQALSSAAVAHLLVQCLQPPALQTAPPGPQGSRPVRAGGGGGEVHIVFDSCKAQSTAEYSLVAPHSLA